MAIFVCACNFKVKDPPYFYFPVKKQPLWAKAEKQEKN